MPLLLSKSRLNTYTQCPQKYCYSYVDKIVPEKTPVALIEGSAIHHIVENSLVTGNRIPDLAKHTSKEYWQTVQLEKTEYPDQQIFEEAQAAILAESENFLSMIGPLNTYDMETYFEHPLVNPTTGEIHEDILLRGYTDLIVHDNNQTKVIDIKTSGKSPLATQADRALELTVYGYMIASQLGWNCEVPVSFLYLVRSKTPKVIWLNSMRSLPDFIQLYDTVLNISAAIRQGLFWKNHGQHCSWCLHQDMCHQQKHLAA